jgi:hypothetical protein
MISNRSVTGPQTGTGGSTWSRMLTDSRTSTQAVFPLLTGGSVALIRPYGMASERDHDV